MAPGRFGCWYAAPQGPGLTCVCLSSTLTKHLFPSSRSQARETFPPVFFGSSAQRTSAVNKLRLYKVHQVTASGRPDRIWVITFSVLSGYLPTRMITFYMCPLTQGVTTYIFSTLPRNEEVGKQQRPSPCILHGHSPPRGLAWQAFRKEPQVFLPLPRPVSPLPRPTLINCPF